MESCKETIEKLSAVIKKEIPGLSGEMEPNLQLKSISFLKHSKDDRQFLQLVDTDFCVLIFLDNFSNLLLQTCNQLEDLTTKHAVESNQIFLLKRGYLFQVVPAETILEFSFFKIEFQVLNKFPQFPSLPTGVKSHIASFLSVQDISHFILACKECKAITEQYDRKIWRRHLLVEEQTSSSFKSIVQKQLEERDLKTDKSPKGLGLHSSLIKNCI